MVFLPTYPWLSIWTPAVMKSWIMNLLIRFQSIVAGPKKSFKLLKSTRLIVLLLLRSLTDQEKQVVAYPAARFNSLGGKAPALIQSLDHSLSCAMSEWKSFPIASTRGCSMSSVPSSISARR